MDGDREAFVVVSHAERPWGGEQHSEVLAPTRQDLIFFRNIRPIRSHRKPWIAVLVWAVEQFRHAFDLSDLPDVDDHQVLRIGVGIMAAEAGEELVAQVLGMRHGRSSWRGAVDVVLDLAPLG